MFSHLMRRLLATTTSQRRRKRMGVRLQIENLEGKTLLTAIPINFGATVASAPVAIGSELFFAASDATHGNQLWESNGTSSGTIRLSDGNDAYGGINPTDLVAVGNTLYFAANDGARRRPALEEQRHRFGHRHGLRHRAGLGGIFPSELTDVNGALYFIGLRPDRRLAALPEQRDGQRDQDGAWASTGRPGRPRRT